MPEVGEELDVQLIVEVEVGVEAVDDDHYDEEEVDDGEGNDGLMEVGVDAGARKFFTKLKFLNSISTPGASQYNACEKISKDADSPNRGNAHLKIEEILSKSVIVSDFGDDYCI